MTLHLYKFSRNKFLFNVWSFGVNRSIIYLGFLLRPTPNRLYIKNPLFGRNIERRKYDKQFPYLASPISRFLDVWVTLSRLNLCEQKVTGIIRSCRLSNETGRSKTPLTLHDFRLDVIFKTTVIATLGEQTQVRDHLTKANFEK